jgi:sulfite exporter TauE/SafE
MANGLLPCGMVYVAIAGALTTASLLNSVVFMAMFGAGTIPAMMIIGYFGRMVSLPVRNMFRNAVPVFMTIMALVLILRGLNLGIPFISPVLQGPPAEAVSCH